MTTTLQISMQLEGAVRHDADSGVYVSFCPALRIYSQGTTESEAFEALKSAASLFVSACIKRNQLHSVLKDYGFQLAEGAQSITSVMENYIAVQELHYDKTQSFDVPITLLTAQQVMGAGEACLH
jgi:predicted RNase H-like HicB family nuclease